VRVAAGGGGGPPLPDGPLGLTFSQKPSSSDNVGNLSIELHHGGNICKRLHLRPTHAIEKCLLPLGSIVSPAFDYTSLNHMMETYPTALAPGETEDLRMMEQWLTSSIVFDTFRAQGVFESGGLFRAGVSDVPPLYDRFEELVDNHTLATFPGYDSNFEMLMPVFVVAKSDGETSRLIGDARTFNEVFKEHFRVPRCVLPSAPEVFATLIRFPRVWSRDASSMFYQFHTHPSFQRLQRFRVCRHRGHFKRGQFAVMTMGTTFAPAWAQHVANFVVAVTLLRCKANGEVYATAWIDNFIFAAHSEIDEVALATAFEGVINELNFVCKAAEHPVPDDKGDRRFAVLGVEIVWPSTGEPYVHATDKTKSNIKRSANRLLREDLAPSARDVAEWFGTGMWVNFAIIRAPLCLFHDAMQLVRRGCTKAVEAPDGDAWNSTVVLSGTERAAVRRLSQLWLTAKWTELPTDKRPAAESFSDASTFGLAWSLCEAVTKRIILEDSQSAACESKDIYLHEIVASAIPLVEAAHRGFRILRSYIDNLPARDSWVRGHTTSIQGDRAMATAIRAGAAPTLFTWLPSECNMRMDARSRQWEIHPPTIPDEMICHHPHDTKAVRWSMKAVQKLQLF